MAAPTMEIDALYHCCDDYISNILVTYAPIPSGRIRVCIFASAGCQQYPRITLSPTSPLFAAVKHLPHEKQGDFLYQGLAVSILKYFAELSNPVKDALKSRYRAIHGIRETALPTMFDPMHAAEIASNMVRVHHPEQIIQDLEAAFSPRVVPSANVDLLLPPDYFRPRNDSSDSVDTLYPRTRYGIYTEFIKRLGDPIFVPNSKVRRAPSTNASTDTTFPRVKKEAVRLAMCEMVDTEERYVSKLYDLVHNVVKDSRREIKSNSSFLSTQSKAELEKLFPPCLDKILETNAAFLQDIRKSLETTESEAFADIAKDDNTIPPKHDPIGAVAFGKLMRRWLPKFQEPYQEYMRIQPGMSASMSWFMKHATSPISERIQQTGESRLRSLLIEPVQRLPRYTLYIDTMTSKMPANHPAIKHLSRAREIISDICALDGPEIVNNKEQIHNRLHDQIDGLLPAFTPQGRLVTAIDVEQLQAPYRLDIHNTVKENHILVLFTDMLVVLDKPSKCSTTSQTFLSYMEKGSTFNLSQMSRPKTPPQRLRFSGCIHTRYIWASLSPEGQILYIASSEDKSADNSKLRAFKLPTSQAARPEDDFDNARIFCDEIMKTKAEHRFSDEERTSEKWSLHCLQAPSSPTRFFTAICEEESRYAPVRKDFVPFRIIFNRHRTGVSRELVTDIGSAWACANISRSQDDRTKCEVRIQTLFGTTTYDTVNLDEVVSAISRRFSALLPRLYSTENHLLVGIIVMRNSQILDTVCSKGSRFRKGSKSFPSPTKFLASFLGSTKENQNEKPEPQMHIPDEPPTLQLSGGPLSTQTNIERSNSRVKLVGGDKHSSMENHLERLEQTLTAYILSIRARAGNITAGQLETRCGAKTHPAMVNDLYEILLNDPSKIQLAAEAPIDLLFEAFQLFLWTAWKFDMGPIIARHDIVLLQVELATSPQHSRFEDYFKGWLPDLSPQNRRAFTAIVKLLADLLDACGNENDRHILTLVFAELLTANFETKDFVKILNRLVEDYDQLFDDRTVVGFQGQDYSPRNSTSSHSSSADAAKSASTSSKVSSFRRRFFGSRKGAQKSKSKSPPASRGSLFSRRGRSQEEARPASATSSSSQPPLVAPSKEDQAPRGGEDVEELKRLLAASREELRREKREVGRLRGLLRRE